MRVVVTGSGGFIGRAVCQELKQQGHEPVEFNLPVWDIRSAHHTRQRVHGADAVIHLAGVLGTHELFDTPHDAIDTNITGTLNVLAACRQHDARYVGITMPDVFPSIYTATKIAAGRLATAYHHTHGVPVSHVRAYNAFGPGQAHGPGHPQKIVPTFARCAWLGNPLPIWGDGTQTVDLIHVDQLAALLVAALQFGNDEVIEGGTGEPHTVYDVAAMVGDIVGRQLLIEYLPMRRGERPTHIVADDCGPLPLPEFRYSDLRQTVESYR